MIASSPNDSPYPAILRDIIKVEFPGHKMETYLAIEQRLPIKVSSEWFGKYPILQASVWGTGSQDIEIVPASYLRGSYASCALDDKRFVIVSLDRVSNSTVIQILCN